MAWDATSKRRWAGTLLLGTAVLMLAAGETVLKGKLSPAGFLAYWTGCFVATVFAILIAFLDVRALRRRTRDAQRDLIESTLKQVGISPGDSDRSAESRGKPKPGPNN